MKKYLTLDFGGTTIKYAFISENLQLEHYEALRTETEDYERFLENLFHIIEPVQQQIEGICISLPGGVNARTGEVNGAGAIYCLENKPLKQDIENKFHIPVALENDANCAALAEISAGAAKGSKNAVFLVLGTGIGGAVVADGKFLHTKNCFSGEFGYMILDYQNMLTWEDLGGSVIRTVQKITQNEKYKNMDGKEIFDLYRKDAYITEELNCFFKMLACACYSIQTIFDPEVIIIGGAISQRTDLTENIGHFIDKIYEKRSIPKKPVIKTGKYLDSANLIGAYFNFVSYEKGGGNIGITS